MSARTQGLRLVSFTMVLLVLGLTVATANADTITVCWDGSGDYLTIQEGIDAAADGDEVVVCDGTYTGPGNRDLDFHGKAITVRSANGPENCIIDCEGSGRGFFFHNGETDASVVDGFTITNGHANLGGGICCDASNPTIVGCMIVGNAAIGSEGQGGGICCRNNSCPEITGCTIIDNSSSKYGGGVCCGMSCPTIMNCTIMGNAAFQALLAFGGGVYCYGCEATITNCTITANDAMGEVGGYGGGIYCCNDNNLIIMNCTITDNAAQAGGGVCSLDSTTMAANSIIADNWTYGLSGGGFHCDSSAVTITNCTIAGNQADQAGGGVHGRENDSLVLTNCTIAANWAAGDGGALWSERDNLAINCCTITGNMAQGRGGGIYSSLSSTLVINCILWGDIPTEIVVYPYDEIAVRYSDVQYGWLGQGNIGVDPLFVDPYGPDNNPATWWDNDYHLSLGSPCVDAGCNWAVPPDIADLDDDGDTTEYTPVDLDGEGRFFDDPNTDDTGCSCPPIVDMGAYEFGGTGPQPCPGDLDCDRMVGHSDLGILLADWGCAGGNCPGDADGDGDTDHADLGTLLAHWGEGC